MIFCGSKIFRGQADCQGGGSGQSVSLVSGGGEGGGPKLAKKASADI